MLLLRLQLQPPLLAVLAVLSLLVSAVLAIVDPQDHPVHLDQMDTTEWTVSLANQAIVVLLLDQLQN